MCNIEVFIGNINNKNDQKSMLKILDLYMQDPMGSEAPMPKGLDVKLIEELKKQSNYVFFLAKVDGKVAGLANCFVNFSTFKGKQLINIHDFAVNPEFRRKGVGEAMMDKVVEYARENDFCKVTLEVRYDNPKAQNLYKKKGFVECEPPMYFWQRMV